MNIKNVMNPRVELVQPSISLKQAAEKMAEEGVGFLLIGDQGRLTGILTDRDIVLRAVGKGKNVATTPIETILSDRILYCLEDQDLEEVAITMSEQQVRRMPVLDKEGTLVGVVSIGDMARHLDPAMVGEVLSGVTSEIKAA